MALVTQPQMLYITHVPTGDVVFFPAYLEMFSDAYTSHWNAEDVYGRMDPIATFINTRRAISLAWNVPAESYDNAKENMLKLNKLMSFLYPLYDEESDGATAINQAPLMRIQFGNLIRNSKTGGGLLGYMNGFTFDPALEFGMFHNEPRGATQASIKGVDYEYYPKTFRLNTEFNVLHEHALGFKRADATGKSFSFRDKSVTDTNYPYAVADPSAPNPALSVGLLGAEGRATAAAAANIDPNPGGDPEAISKALASKSLNGGDK